MYAFLSTLAFVVCGASVRATSLMYTLRAGVRISSGGTVIIRSVRAKMTVPFCASLCGATCGAFQVSSMTDECVTFSERFHTKGIELTSDPEWTLGYSQSSVSDGDWTLAFRAQTGLNAYVYKTWVSDGTHHDSPEEAGDFPQVCLRLVDYGSCDRYFRSQILDNWEKIQEVRFSMVKSGAEVAYAVFNGTGTDRESWFHPSRIMSSSWQPGVTTDTLTRPEIKGYCGGTGTACRRFKLYGASLGCPKEWAYTVTIDAPYDACVDQGHWPTAGDPAQDFPVFLYSQSGRGGLGESAEYPLIQRADVMAVWVKFAWPPANK
ncbi:hypothetical protein EGW08_019545 [Elysia chlorotica]|uniref:Uncharacterized protein n=1 Tax=Elysia chlorotica TaxID=188477 RepID=A0A3S1H5L8_ELYCH|nr:hypothetical protein EGW08_019545 [Elysia chlorotica]